ncbi:MAG TPA: hypothetical protein VGD68_03875 [Streptosporangiaceae bacterium]
MSTPFRTETRSSSSPRATTSTPEAPAWSCQPVSCPGSHDSSHTSWSSAVCSRWCQRLSGFMRTRCCQAPGRPATERAISFIRDPLSGTATPAAGSAAAGPGPGRIGIQSVGAVSVKVY